MGSGKKSRNIFETLFKQWATIGKLIIGRATDGVKFRSPEIVSRILQGIISPESIPDARAALDEIAALFRAERGTAPIEKEKPPVPAILKIDRSRPFDPVAFLGEGWKIDEQDERSLALAEIDLNKVRLEDMLLPKDKGAVQGEEKLRRLKKAGHVRLDAAVFKALWDNPQLIPEHWKGKYVYFDGTVLRSPSDYRCVLYLYWSGSQWDWHYNWLGSAWHDDRLSAVLAPRQGSGQASV